MPRLHGSDLDKHLQDEPGQSKPRTMKSTGPATEALDAPVVEPVDGPALNKEWADNMAFNETFVTIRIQQSNDPKANPLPDIYNNGTPQRFIRGQAQKVKWKYVEQLARCRTTTYREEKFYDSDNVEQTRYIPQHALTFPFDKGDDWRQEHHDRLDAIMREA